MRSFFLVGIPHYTITPNQVNPQPALVATLSKYPISGKLYDHASYPNLLADV